MIPGFRSPVARLFRALAGCATVFGLAACDQPGPLSAAARGDEPPPPAPPAWSAALLGQPLKVAFPGTFACVAAVDGPAGRFKGFRRIHGWGWKPLAARPVDHVAIVDAQGVMVGFGDGGQPRPDVPKARPQVTSDLTGWTALSPLRETSYQVFGIALQARAACPMGRVTLHP
jgi:hypothetical protein